MKNHGLSRPASHPWNGTNHGQRDWRWNLPVNWYGEKPVTCTGLCFFQLRYGGHFPSPKNVHLYRDLGVFSRHDRVFSRHKQIFSEALWVHMPFVPVTNKCPVPLGSYAICMCFWTVFKMEPRFQKSMIQRRAWSHDFRKSFFSEKTGPEFYTSNDGETPLS